MNYVVSVLLVFISLLAARFAELPANITPLLAAAVIAPQFVKHRAIQWGLPVAVLFVSDLVLGFYSAAPVVYAMVIFASIMGTHVKNMYAAGVVSVFAWHIVVNGSLWFYGSSNVSLAQLYWQAIPFDFRLLCSTLFFLALFDITQKFCYTVRNKTVNG